MAAECSNAEDVGDGVGVPALGEHRNAHDAADVGAELALLADGVHDLTQQVLVRELVGVGAGVALAVLGLELGDLQTGGLLEVVLERLAGLELGRVDQDAERPSDRLTIDDVAEQGEVARLVSDDLAVLDDRLASDPVVDELAHHGVGADHDEDGRCLAVRLEHRLPMRRTPSRSCGRGCAGPPQAPWAGASP